MHKLLKFNVITERNVEQKSWEMEKLKKLKKNFLEFCNTTRCQSYKTIYLCQLIKLEFMASFSNLV